MHLNDEEVGRTPLTVPFIDYGTYQVQLQRDDYETILTERSAEAPWWDTLGPDLIAELSPGLHKVQIDWHFDLEKRKPVDEQELIDRALKFRQKVRKHRKSLPSRRPQSYS